MYQILSCQQFALEEFLSGWSWKNQWRFGCYYLFVLRNDIKQKYLSDARIRSPANHKNDWPQDAPIVADLISLMLLFWLFSSIYWRRLSVGPYHPCQLYINVLYLSKCYKPHRASLTLVQQTGMTTVILFGVLNLAGNTRVLSAHDIIIKHLLIIIKHGGVITWSHTTFPPPKPDLALKTIHPGSRREWGIV